MVQKKKKILRCCLGDGIFMCRCCSPCSQGRGSHNEYYHISARLHLSQIILLPSRAWANIKGCCVILHSCQSITTSGASPLMKSPAPRAPTAIFNDFPKTHSGFSGTVHHSGRVKWDTWSILGAFWYEQSHSFSSLYLFSPFMMHMYPPWARGGCESGGREPEPQITAMCASVTAWLAAPHKILFTAHTGEKLQQQSSPEGGKSADLATLRERPEGGSGTIIIILLPLIHCRYLYCSHSLWGIQPTGDNRLLVHKRMIKRQ